MSRAAKMTPEQIMLKRQAVARAQSLAKTELTKRHPDEYRRLYADHVGRILADSGLDADFRVVQPPLDDLSGHYGNPRSNG